MKYIVKPHRNAGLWWLSLVSMALGLSIYLFLKPAEYDLDIQKIRSFGLITAILIPGICLIVGTSRRWFGKDL